MIKKILVRDYLKGYGDMTVEERMAFVGRVGEWLASDGARLLAMTDRPMAKSQNLVTISTRWTAEDAKAVTDGIMLMSAMVAVADTWLPTQIYMRSAYRAIRQVVSVLSEVKSEEFFAEQSGKAERRVKNFLRPNGSKRPEVERLPPSKATAQNTSGMGKATGRRPEAGNAAAPYNQEPKRAAGAGAGKPQALPSSVGATASPGSKRQGGDAIATQQTKKEQQRTDTSLTSHLSPLTSKMVPARPKHIDQYVHLLPKATQERAAEYGELMRQLGEARDNMQLLMDDDHASAKSREQWAKQATKIDKKIRAIRDELDREWEKVVADNRIALDAFGNAYVVEMRNEKGEMRNGDAAADTSLTSDLSPLASELSSEQKKRRRDLRKWLIDLRRGKEGKDREKRIEQWRVNWKEYLTLEPRKKAMEDEKILEAAKHFGIDLTQIATN